MAIALDPPTLEKMDVGGAHPLLVPDALAQFPSPQATLGTRDPGQQQSNLQCTPLLVWLMVVPATPVAVLGGVARSPSPLVGSHTPPRLDLHRSVTVAGARSGRGTAGCLAGSLAAQDRAHLLCPVVH
jgi:hypothetical protein